MTPAEIAQAAAELNRRSGAPDTVTDTAIIGRVASIVAAVGKRGAA